MNTRGKRLVQLALFPQCDSSHKNDIDKESESDVAIFSSDTDEDPTYLPSESDNEFPNLLERVLNERQNNTHEISSHLENSVQNMTVSSSSENSPPSPHIRTAPTIEIFNEERISEEAALPSTNNNIIRKNRAFLRIPDFCYYCESEVQNYARHIRRNHSQELEVQKIFSLPPKSVERKQLIACLRKKGNFLKNSESLYKPVHKSVRDNSETNYIACPFCFGMYSKKLLWRHKKTCSKNLNPGARMSLSEGQNLLIPNLKSTSDTNLREKVFPRMRADKVSLASKKDYLICAFGSRYLNTHREQHHINVCSRKMRELAKVLMESQKINSSIKNLFDLLQPQHFDVVVQAVKIIAKYDPEKDIYVSPTFAMNISRSLKDCCDIAILFIVKRKHNDNKIPAAEAEANVTMFIRLLESTWKYEISSQAGNDLNTKTWNKITLIPLAADLKLLRTYLVNKGNEAEQKLKKHGDNQKNYTLLMETVFCRLLLLNRKRVGELQRMKVSTYLLTDNNNTQNYEEFSEAITPTEKVLLKSFKRVVTRGKRGRGVPVLFSNDIQDHIKLLLELRPLFVQKDNLFLFPNLKSDQPITGYKILHRHANLCGAKNPNALTSTKLRKHLATLSQVLNMTTGDIEQLATFMGHTMNVHSKAYRLPDDVFQTAKIAKLLMLMEKGDAGKFKGKTLEEIDVNLDEEIGEDETVENEVENLINVAGSSADESILENQDEEEKENTRPNSKSKATTTKTKQRTLVPWTSEQKKVVLQFFKNHIKSKKPPKRSECEILTNKHSDLLKNKSWLKIKVFVQNHYTKKTKMQEDSD